MSTWLIILLALLSLILLLLLAILIAPFQLIIDSRNGRASFEWQPFGRAAILVYTNDLTLKFQVLFWKKELSLFSLKSGKKKEEKPVKQAKSKTGRAKFLRKKIVPIWRSFKVKKFNLQLDTDDFCRNAYLYPLFYLISNGKNRQLSVNFQGDTELLLIIENRMIRILRAIIF